MELYANGTRLEDICKLDWAQPHKPSTIRTWGEEIPGFRDEFARAHRRHADALAAGTLDVLDQERDPQRARVAIQARQWLAGKYRPQTYGEKLEITADTRVSLVDAINAGQARLLPHRDQLDDGDSQTPVMIDVSPNATTDQTSDATGTGDGEQLPDFFD